MSRMTRHAKRQWHLDRRRSLAEVRLQRYSVAEHPRHDHLRDSQVIGFRLKNFDFRSICLDSSSRDLKVAMGECVRVNDLGHDPDHGWIKLLPRVFT